MSKGRNLYKALQTPLDNIFKRSRVGGGEREVFPFPKLKFFDIRKLNIFVGFCHKETLCSTQRGLNFKNIPLIANYIKAIWGTEEEKHE